MNVTVQDLFEAGVHLGHQRRRWNPKSQKFVYGCLGGLSIIDLEKTLGQLQKASDFLEETAANGQSIWFVGTKASAQEAIRESARSVHLPFVANRWLGGCLTNFETVHRSLNKYRHYLRMQEDGSLDAMLKKEASVIRRQMARLFRSFEGLVEVTQLPSALLVVDIHKESIAVAEARRLGIPVVALVDTNSNPELVSYPIPANDDLAKSIQLLLSCLMEAIERGQALFEAKKRESRQLRTIPTQEVLVSDAEDAVKIEGAIDIQIEEEH
ncbi:MAG: 30S ribosomal protein S2 [Puniceicoccales bacterium]|jgi:small subunit ribosomal protein S2|nr:30S ribosomal protein S2 [Puniceicoccales bacterium]